MNIKEYMDKITENFNNVEDKYKLREELKYSRYIRLLDIISRVTMGFEHPANVKTTAKAIIVVNFFIISSF